MEFKSESGEFILKTIPRDERDNTCWTGKFYKKEKNRNTLLWTTSKIDISINSAYIADSGKYVVILNTFGFTHDKNNKNVEDYFYAPNLVICNHKGKVIYDANLKALDLIDDIKYMATDEDDCAIYWLTNTINFFGPNDETFLMQFPWGKLLIIDLASGDIVNEKWFEQHKKEIPTENSWDALIKYANDKVKEKSLKYLTSSDAYERKTGAIMCEKMNFRESIPALREMLDSTENYIYFDFIDYTSLKLYYLRKAAKQALEKMGEPVENILIEEEDTSFTATEYYKSCRIEAIDQTYNFAYCIKRSNEADALVSQKRYEDAINVMKEVIAIYPGTPSYRAQLGQIYIDLGQYDKAIELLENKLKEELQEIDKGGFRDSFITAYDSLIEKLLLAFQKKGNIRDRDVFIKYLLKEFGDIYEIFDVIFNHYYQYEKPETVEKFYRNNKNKCIKDNKFGVLQKEVLILILRNKFKEASMALNAIKLKYPWEKYKADIDKLNNVLEEKRTANLEKGKE